MTRIQGILLALPFSATLAFASAAAAATTRALPEEPCTPGTLSSYYEPMPPCVASWGVTILSSTPGDCNDDPALRGCSWDILVQGTAKPGESCNWTASVCEDPTDGRESCRDLISGSAQGFSRSHSTSELCSASFQFNTRIDFEVDGVTIGSVNFNCGPPCW